MTSFILYVLGAILMYFFDEEVDHTNSDKVSRYVMMVMWPLAVALGAIATLPELIEFIKKKMKA